MAIALLKSRRVIMEQGAEPDKSDAGRQRIYEEANKLDGYIVLAEGGMKKFKIVENADLAPGQSRLMESSENEINEIVGANIAAMGYESNEKSGIALEKKVQQSNILTASLFENLRRSLKRLGEHIVSNIQGFWTKEKVLRITDRMTGAEKFVEINKRMQGMMGGYEIKNNVSQGKYDIIVSEAPRTDTAKEKQIDLLIAWAQKSPPEAIPLLISTAFEIMDLPNKEILLTKLKPLLGQDPTEQDMSAEQIKQKVVQQLQVQQEEGAKQKRFADAAIQLDLENKGLLNKKLQAEIDEIGNRQKIERAKVVNDMAKNVLPFPKPVPKKPQQRQEVA